MKKTIQNLAKNLVLGATLTAGTLGLLPANYSNTAQAQRPTPADVHFYGRQIKRGARINHDRDMMMVGEIVHGLAHLAAIAPGPEYPDSSVYPGQRPIRQIAPEASFYVYNNFRDLNSNNWADSPNELIGAEKKNFWEDEPVKIGIRTKGLRGRKATYELIGPEGERLYSGAAYPKTNNWFQEMASFNKGLSNTLEKYGQGIYEVRFFIDNQHIGSRKFLLEANTQVGVCNNWIDVNHDNLLDKKTELPGLGKTSFNENETITPVLFSRNQKNALAEIKLYNPQGQEITSKKETNGSNKCWHVFPNNVRDLVSEHGPGTYLAGFFVNNESTGTVQFQLNGTQKPNSGSADKKEIIINGIKGYILDGRFIPYETRQQDLETISTPQPEELKNKNLESKLFDFPTIQGRRKIKDLELGILNPVESYFFEDLSPPLAFDKPLVVVSNNGILIAGSENQESYDVTYHRNGRKIIAQALKQGEVRLSFEKDKVEAITIGPYNLINGGFIETNGSIKRLNQIQEKTFQPSRKTIPLHITRFDIMGEELGQEFYNADGTFSALGAPVSLDRGNKDLDPALGISPQKNSEYSPTLAPKLSPKPLTPEQQSQINRFWQTISKRKSGLADPLGFNFTEQQILELKGDFSEENIKRNVRR